MKDIFNFKNGCYFLLGIFLYGTAAAAVKFFMPAAIGSIAFLPMILGVIGGPPAAYGAALGSLAGDYCAGSILYLSVTTALTVFLQAYLPFKLWYTSGRDEEAALFLCSGKAIVKFIYVVFCTVFLTGSMLGLTAESVRMQTAGDFFLDYGSKALDAGFIFGGPLLLLFSEGHVKAYLPKTAAPGQKGFNYTLLLYFAAAAGVGYAAFSKLFGVMVEPYLAFSAWLALFLLALTMAFKTAQVLPREFLGSERKKHSLAVNAGSFFFAVSFVFIAFGVFTAYQNAAQKTLLECLGAWGAVKESVFYFLHCIFAVTLIFLWRVEKKFRRLRCKVKKTRLIARSIEENQRLTEDVPAQNAPEVLKTAGDAAAEKKMSAAEMAAYALRIVKKKEEALNLAQKERER